MTQTTRHMSSYFLFWMYRPCLLRETVVCPYCTLYAYLFLKKGSIHIVQFARCLFILYLFVFYNLYSYVVKLTIYHCIPHYHSFPVLLLLPFVLIFLT